MENTKNIEAQSALTPPLKSIVVNGKKKIAVNGVVNLNIPQGGGGGTQVQADWNQNDENAPDYIKNRICSNSFKNSLWRGGDGELICFSDRFTYDWEGNYVETMAFDITNIISKIQASSPDDVYVKYQGKLIANNSSITYKYKIGEDIMTYEASLDSNLTGLEEGEMYFFEAFVGFGYTKNSDTLYTSGGTIIFTKVERLE